MSNTFEPLKKGGQLLPYTGRKISLIIYYAEYLIKSSTSACKGKGKVIPLQARCGPEGG